MIADLVIANLLRIAREDLDGAVVLAQRGNRNAAYLCEQAAEKVIRAVLTSEGKHAGVRHQLDEMVNLVPDENPLKPALREVEELAALLDKVGAVLGEAATRFGVDLAVKGTGAARPKPIR